MASTEEKNSYELLGVTPDSTEGEIKTAYRKLSLKVHPDRVRLFSGTPIVQDLPTLSCRIQTIPMLVCNALKMVHMQAYD
jgi:hypothetical protein